MLSPSTLEQLPNDLTDLINELQTEIIRSVSKKISKANYLTPAAEWQLYKAQMLQSSTSEVNKLIAQYTGLSRREVKGLYTEACKKAIANDAKIYRMAGKDASSFFRSVALSNSLRAGIRNANGLMKNITRSMVQSSRATVTHLMDKAYVQVLSGAFSPQEAVYSAVKELADKGIQSVTYPSGKSDWADVAVRRAVLTALGQTTGRIQLDLAAEMDCDLVEVTSHGDARPSHAEWQGQVYSISGKSKKYPPLSRTGYGTGDGLKGWNCRHDFFPFFEGISERASFPIDKEENAKEYAATQRQRAIERSIRSSKRGLAALDSSIQSTDDESLKEKLKRQFDRKSNTLKKQEARLAEHCKASGLLPRPDRTRVVGFNKSVSQKAVHGNRRYTAKKAVGSPSGNSGNTSNFSLIPKNLNLTNAVNNDIIGTVGECKDIPSAVKHFMDKWGVILDPSLDKLDFDSVLEGLRGIEVVLEEFPQAREHLHRISLGTLKDKAIMETTFSGTIRYSKDYYKNRESILSALFKSSSHFHPDGSNCLSFGAHEMGHILDGLIISRNTALSYTDKSNAWKKHTEATKIVNRAIERIKGKTHNPISKYLMKSKISIYSTYNNSECISEAIADYIIHGDNSNELSKAIWNILKEELI